MLSGVPVPAKKALDQGILDDISTGDLVEDAISFLHKKFDETTEHPKVRDLNEKLVEVLQLISHLSLLPSDVQLFHQTFYAKS